MPAAAEMAAESIDVEPMPTEAEPIIESMAATSVEPDDELLVGELIDVEPVAAEAIDVEPMVEPELQAPTEFVGETTGRAGAIAEPLAAEAIDLEPGRPRARGQTEFVAEPS